MHELEWNEGEFVWVVGRIAQIPWQHLVRSPAGKTPIYVDVIDGGQMVVYVAAEPHCRENLLFEGLAVHARGPAKRPGSDEHYLELQLDAISWACVDIDSIPRLLDRLADPSLPSERKDAAEGAIVALNLDAIPPLLEHLKDPRVCRRDRVLLNEGELLNQPPHATPPAEIWQEVDITLGERCDHMLRRIVTPWNYRSPHMTNAKPRSLEEGFFRVEDWHAWWESHRGMPLPKIHDEMKPVIDAYWRTHGEMQRVP